MKGTGESSFVYVGTFGSFEFLSWSKEWPFKYT